MAFRLLFYILICSILFSCEKENPISVDFTSYALSSSQDINQIKIQNDSLIMSCGNRYSTGSVWISSAQNISFDQRFNFNQRLVDISYSSQGFYFLPVGNSVIYSGDAFNFSDIYQNPGWEFFHSFIQVGIDSFVKVGGENYGKGIIHQSFSNNLTVDTISNELKQIIQLPNKSLLSCGYGVVLRSNDLANSWSSLNLRGDFFTGLSFVDDNTGFVCGNFGSIYKTEDGGNQWKQLSAANTFFNDDKMWNKIHFIDKDRGLVIGNNGAVWITKNGGKSWVPIQNLPRVNYYSLAFYQQDLFIGGSNGILLKISGLF
jgi:hypothetical protein